MNACSEEPSASEQLERERELTRHILEAMPGGIVHVAADGAILRANAEALRVLGLRLDDLTQRYTTDFAVETLNEDGSPCPVEDYPVSRALATGTPQPARVIGVRRPDGSVAWAVFRAVPVLDPSTNKATSAVVTFIDITDRRDAETAEAEVARLRTQIAHAQKIESLGLLAGGVAHDFNNLLAAIAGNASLAKIQLASGSEAAQCVDAIETATRRAADLTGQMLTYAGRGSVRIGPVDLTRLVADISELLATIVSKRATLKVEFAEDLPAIEGDVSQVRQVAMNLIMNASDALGEGPGVITVRGRVIEMSRDALAATYVNDNLAEGNYVCLEVEDTGQGMSAETAARVFDPFFSTKTTGRGLGLAATLGIVRAHRGAIELFSEPGRGTRFCVYFPISSRLQPASEPPASVEPGLRGETVLVVDDEPAVLQVACSLLREFGYDVIAANSGHDGVAQYQKHAAQIDAVVLDMTMPDLSGGEVLDELRRHDPLVRVVLCSGYTEEDIASRIETAQVSAFLQKPYSAAALVSAIERALKRDR